ncbi:MAG: hypothetical protein ACREQ5_08040 [Candidatus Dormibacteria bacterium]
MKRLLVICVVLGVMPNMVGAGSAVKGVVSDRISGCDYFLVESKNGYDLLEWFGGSDPDKGDTIIGNYETFGFHDVYNETADESMRIYTEDYDLSRSDGLEKLVDSCGQ